MKRMAVVLILALAVGIALGGIGNQLLNAQQERVQVTELLKTDLMGSPGKEGIVALVAIAPGAAVGQHFPPGDAFVYVLEGLVLLEVEGRPPVTLKPGATGYMPSKQVHNVKNARQTAPVKLLAFLIAEKGQPVATPIPPAQSRNNDTPIGSCRHGESCPSGTVCSGFPAFVCSPKGRPSPICLASHTKIATPQGVMNVEDLQIGMLVWTIDAQDEVVATPIVKTSVIPVSPAHSMIHLALADGRELWASPGHLTYDGRTVDQFKTGDLLDGSLVVRVEIAPYQETQTYDVLPAGDSRIYWANGIPLMSTLQ